MNCPKCNQPMLLAADPGVGKIGYACPMCLIYVEEKDQLDKLKDRLVTHLLEIQQVIEENPYFVKSEYDMGYCDALETEQNFIKIALGEK